MSGPLRVGLLFGGRSVEHEVSVVSARGVAAAMRETELRCVPLGVTGEGRWISPELSRRILEGTASRVDPGADESDGVRVVVDPGGGGLLRCTPGGLPEPLEIDVVFPLVHGWGGEDGRVQGALELAGVPYVGAGVLGSAAGMDKAIAKQVFERRGLAVAPWLLVERESWDAERPAIEGRVEEAVGFPAFVKPANGGSSVGVGRVAGPAGLGPALEVAFRHDRRAVVERGIDAREIECGVLGNERPEASGLGEILPSREFYDYAAKYLDGTSGLEIPARLDEGTREALRRDAVTAFRCLDLCGFARVDFLLDRASGTGYINEVNTLPGFTPISMFPKLWEAAGLAYPRLIERLVSLAQERWRSTASRSTSLDAGEPRAAPRRVG